jgi:anti-sigma factor RsiW
VAGWRCAISSAIGWNSSVADLYGSHADHDPSLTAGLLDRDVSADDRAAAETLIADCPECAALHADLISLSAATRELPRLARPRDFRLTPADAERLAAMMPREPEGAISRRMGVMTDRPTASHDTHDAMLVASLADHSLPDGERTAAEGLIASCRDCADLHADLVALRAATVAMPTPARTRDYTLTADDALRLQPRGWRRLVSAFGTTRDAFSRPLAVGLTTLGLAGLLVTSLPSILPGGATSATGSLSTVGGPVPAGAPLQAPGTNAEAGNGSGAPAVPAAAAASAAPSGEKSVGAGGPVSSPVPVALPAASPGTDFGGSQPAANTFGPARSFGDTAGVTGGPTPTPGALADLDSSGRQPEAAQQLGIPPLAIVSTAFILVGLGLFAIRWGARHLGDG